MKGNDGLKRASGAAYVMLSLGSLMLIFGSVYLIGSLSTIYGVGLGASLQSNADGSPLSQSAAILVSQLSTIGRGILESYVLFVISLILSGAAMMLLLSRKERPTRAAGRYTLLNASFSIVYILVFFIASSDLILNSQSAYLYVPYVGFLVCIGADIYIEYLIRAWPASPGQGAMRSMSIDPSRPFSNMMALQEGLFPSMSGHLRIVDKHFNSAAMSNFYRLVGKSIGRFGKITVLTSKEMMNSSFPEDVKDMRSELGASGVGFEVRLMDDMDSVEQHERMMLDDSIAYKMPPFNVINRRSEHITRISFKDADRRFSHLYGRATTIENYEIKKGR